MNLEVRVTRAAIRRIVLTLSIVSALWVVLGIVTQVISPGESELYTWTHLFDLDAEATLPAWFQTAMLLCIGALAWTVGNTPSASLGHSRYWKSLGWIFVYLSADENAAIHETLGFWISAHFGHKMGVYAWLIPGLVFVAIMAVTSWKALRPLPPAIRRGMILAAIVYVAGAAGFEVIESRIDELWGTLSFSLVAVCEETLEMVGMIIMIHTLLSHLGSASVSGRSQEP